MAIDSFLKVGTLKGESVVKGFEDQMQKQQQQLRSRSFRRTQPDDTKDTTKPSADAREKESDDRDSEDTKAADKAETRANNKAADADGDSEPL